MRKRCAFACLVLLACAAGSSRPLSGANLEAQSGNLLTVFDRYANAISVTNRFDGSSYYVQTTSYNRNRGVNWDRTHYDGYQETANAVALDGGNNIYIAGVRFWQDHKYFWLMKYSPAGDLLWERSDINAPDCSAFNVIADETGLAWIAGSCVGNNSFPAHIILYDPTGGTLWTRNYDGGGRNYVRNLSLDYAARVSLAVELSGNMYWGGAPTVRTIVYDKQGGQVAIY